MSSAHEFLRVDEVAVILRTTPKAIYAMVEHQDLSMTQRHMHLSLVALHEAIRLLDQPVRRQPASAARSDFGDMLETEGGRQKMLNKSGH